MRVPGLHAAGAAATKASLVEDIKKHEEATAAIAADIEQTVLHQAEQRKKMNACNQAVKEAGEQRKTLQQAERIVQRADKALCDAQDNLNRDVSADLVDTRKRIMQTFRRCVTPTAAVWGTRCFVHVLCVTSGREALLLKQYHAVMQGFVTSQAESSRLRTLVLVANVGVDNATSRMADKASSLTCVSICVRRLIGVPLTVSDRRLPSCFCCVWVSGCLGVWVSGCLCLRARVCFV